MGYLQCFSSEFETEPTDATIGAYNEDLNAFERIPETNGNK